MKRLLFWGLLVLSVLWGLLAFIFCFVIPTRLHMTSFFARMCSYGAFFLLNMQVRVQKWKSPEVEFERLLGSGDYSSNQLEQNKSSTLRSPQKSSFAIYLSNHQSYFDVCTFGAVSPENMCILGKKELRWIPGFAWFFWRGRNYFVDRKNPSWSGLAKVCDRLEFFSQNLWVFPEGTRNFNSTQLKEFKKGPFLMAKKMRCPLFVVIAPNLKTWMQVNWKPSWSQLFNDRARQTMLLYQLGPYDSSEYRSIDQWMQKVQQEAQSAYTALNALHEKELKSLPPQELIKLC